jgi:hypothetical protein
MLPRSEAIALVILAAICVVGVIVCAVAHDPVPAVLGDLAFAATGAAAGAVIPGRSGSVP